jgi:hypothetical protein
MGEYANLMDQLCEVELFENSNPLLSQSLGPRLRGTRSLGPPLKRCERYTAARVEANTFTLEEAALNCIVSGGCADCSLRIHDSLPRNGGARRQRVECVTDETRLSRHASESRHLSIGSNPAARYP